MRYYCITIDEARRGSQKEMLMLFMTAGRLTIPHLPKKKNDKVNGETQHCKLTAEEVWEGLGLEERSKMKGRSRWRCTT